MKYYVFNDEVYIKVEELIDFTSKENNNKIEVKGRIYASPVCCKDCKFGEWYVFVDKIGETETAIYCCTYDVFKDIDGYCDEGEKRDEID